jgi:hypothetical protein
METSWLFLLPEMTYRWIAWRSRFSACSVLLEVRSNCFSTCNKLRRTMFPLTSMLHPEVVFLSVIVTVIVWLWWIIIVSSCLVSVTICRLTRLTGIWLVDCIQVLNFGASATTRAGPSIDLAPPSICLRTSTRLCAVTSYTHLQMWQTVII